MDATSHEIRHAPPTNFRLSDVSVRLARPDECARWDALMDRRHYLGFKRFAGRGLRYVFEWREEWLGLAGWQTGAFKCRPRDDWIGWRRELRFSRLHLIANNTRFLILAEPGVFPNLASRALAAMTRRLSDDWLAAFGHGLLLAEAFVDPSRFSGDMYAAAGWKMLGVTKGFARSGGGFTEQRGVGKELHVTPLRRDARRRMCAPDPLPADFAANRPTGFGSTLTLDRLRALHDDLREMDDIRRAQGRKHTVASVIAIYVAAHLSGTQGGIHAAQFARTLNQRQLAALGAWRSPETGRFEPPSKSVIYRVLEAIDPAAIEKAIARWAPPRLRIGAALAADGKRLRGANRGGGGRFETATAVAHDTGLPVASRRFRDGSGEIETVRALLDEASISGRVVTLDALHAVRDTARGIVETHGADYVMSVKENASETFAALASIDWESAKGFFREDATMGRGRIERCDIRTVTPLKVSVNYPRLAQIFRIECEREEVESGEKSTEIVYGITSVAEDRGAPEQLLAWDRGHRSIENRSHRSRDVGFGEDASRSRTAHGPGGSATDDGIVLAVVLHRSPASLIQDGAAP